MVLELVEELEDTFGVEPVLHVIDEPSSTFYFRRRHRDNPSARQRSDTELLARIRDIHTDNEEVYEAPRVHAILRREGRTVGRERVERLMREHHIVGVSPAKGAGTTVRNPADPLSDDLVKRNFTAPAPDRLWVTDLTEIQTGRDGKCYPAAIRDAFSRKIVAWATSGTADANLVCCVLKQALASRNPPTDESLIHHADHGSQYTSIKLTARLLLHGIRPSMGTVGASYDSALAENMWSLIKTECPRRKAPFRTHAEVENALLDYIDGFYNPRRIQKRLGWLSPDEYETAWHTEQAEQDTDTRPATGPAETTPAGDVPLFRERAGGRGRAPRSPPHPTPPHPHGLNHPDEPPRTLQDPDRHKRSSNLKREAHVRGGGADQIPVPSGPSAMISSPTEPRSTSRAS